MNGISVAAAAKASPKVSKRSGYYRGINAILSKRPPPVPVKELILSWNERIGDAGMDHLHLLPESVNSLGFTRCGITANGIKTLCGFVETRETINSRHAANEYFRPLHITWRGGARWYIPF